MESSDVRDGVRDLVRQNDQIINLLRRIEALLTASTGKVAVEGQYGRVIAIDGGQLTTQEMLSFVDEKLQYIPRSFTGCAVVWDSTCPREPEYFYALPIDRDFTHQPLSYKECCKIQQVLYNSRRRWHLLEKREP